MAEENLMSVVVTKAKRLPDLSIKDGQLVFISDIQKIALDFNGKRTFYNTINTLETEEERKILENPVVGLYYFVIESAVLWTYQATGWIQLTNKPDEVIYIGDDLPELGFSKSLYVNKKEKNISVWNETEEKYEIVSDCTVRIEEDDILSLFN